MRVAIITASIGNGHNSVAYAIQEAVEKESNAIVKVFDMLDDNKIAQLTKNIYLEILSKTPNLYSKLYHWSQENEKTSKIKSYFNFLCKRTLQRIKKEYMPDAFIFTHPFPTLGYSKTLNIPAWTIITDYSYHPIWLNSQLNGYFVPCIDIKKSLENNSFQKNRIYQTGIPIKKGFYKKTSINNYDIYTQNPLILIMGGGLGLGPLKEIVEQLDVLQQSFKGIVLTGKNDALYHDISKSLGGKNKSKWEILSYSEEVHLLMSKASLLITKAGAITLTEALASNLPTIIYKPIPGHEEANARYVCSQGWATWAKDSTELINTIDVLLQTPQRLKSMKKRAALLRSSDASTEIAKIVLDQVKISYERSI